MIKLAKVGQYNLIFDRLHALAASRHHLLRLRDLGNGGGDGSLEKGD